MITFRKRRFAANTTAALGTVFLASALSAGTLVRDEDGSDADSTETVSVVKQVEPSARKGDLKIDLADVHSRPIRCVSKFRETTCTGWPLSHGMIALNEK